NTSADNSSEYCDIYQSGSKVISSSGADSITYSYYPTIGLTLPNVVYNPITAFEKVSTVSGLNYAKAGYILLGLNIYSPLTNTNKANSISKLFNYAGSWTNSSYSLNWNLNASGSNVGVNAFKVTNNCYQINMQTAFNSFITAYLGNSNITTVAGDTIYVQPSWDNLKVNISIPSISYNGNFTYNTPNVLTTLIRMRNEKITYLYDKNNYQLTDDTVDWEYLKGTGYSALNFAVENTYSSSNITNQGFSYTLVLNSQTINNIYFLKISANQLDNVVLDGHVDYSNFVVTNNLYAGFTPATKGELTFRSDEPSVRNNTNTNKIYFDNLINKIIYFNNATGNRVFYMCLQEGQSIPYGAMPSLVYKTEVEERVVDYYMTVNSYAKELYCYDGSSGLGTIKNNKTLSLREDEIQYPSYSHKFPQDWKQIYNRTGISSYNYTIYLYWRLISYNGDIKINFHYGAYIGNETSTKYLNNSIYTSIFEGSENIVASNGKIVNGLSEIVWTMTKYNNASIKPSTEVNLSTILKEEYKNTPLLNPEGTFYLAGWFINTNYMLTQTNRSTYLLEQLNDEDARSIINGGNSIKYLSYFDYKTLSNSLDDFLIYNGSAINMHHLSNSPSGQVDLYAVWLPCFSVDIKNSSATNSNQLCDIYQNKNIVQPKSSVGSVKLIYYPTISSSINSFVNLNYDIKTALDKSSTANAISLGLSTKTLNSLRISAVNELDSAKTYYYITGWNLIETNATTKDYTAFTIKNNIYELSLKNVLNQYIAYYLGNANVKTIEGKIITIQPTWNNLQVTVTAVEFDNAKGTYNYDTPLNTYTIPSTTHANFGKLMYFVDENEVKVNADLTFNDLKTDKYYINLVLGTNKITFNINLYSVLTEYLYFLKIVETESVVGTIICPDEIDYASNNPLNINFTSTGYIPYRISATVITDTYYQKYNKTIVYLLNSGKKVYYMAIHNGTTIDYNSLPVIRYENDVEEVEIRKIGENAYLIQGTTSLEEVEEMFDVEFENHDDFDTIGGYLISCLGRIPNNKEKPTIYVENIMFKIERMDDKRV
ncbi:MAG: hypothetical protein IJX26_00075, partial [Clostridia bacterium]|nr:hypothetical protein [Clostridia bacterium]